MIPFSVRAIYGKPFTYRDKTWSVSYYDTNTFGGIPEGLEITQVYGVCFTADGKLLVGLGPSGRWALLGGSPQPGESWQQTLERELAEEAKMRVLECQPLGYQVLVEILGPDVDRTVRPKCIVQTRAFAVVEPIGPFVPSEEVRAIEFIHPDRASEYFDWGPIGAHIIARGTAMFAAPTQ